MDIIYRVASRDDLLGIGRVYVRAFPDSLRQLRSPNLSPRAVADVAGACFLAEHDCIMIAETRDGSEQIIGYIIAPCDAGGPARVALRRGLVFVWLWRWATGRYRIALRGALGVLRDKLHFRGTWIVPGAECGAAVLSIAVDPSFQGRGVGKRLLTEGISRLQRLNCECVRLEVRPDNEPARRLYEHVGFRRVGEFRDSRGPWVTMTLDVVRPAHDA
jgi:ribosomal-protein-alanine N-acetyltransferase